MDDRNSLCNSGNVIFPHAIQLVAEESAILVLQTDDIQVAAEQDIVIGYTSGCCNIFSRFSRCGNDYVICLAFYKPVSGKSVLLITFLITSDLYRVYNSPYNMHGLPVSDRWSLDIPEPLLNSAIKPSLEFSHSPLNSGNLKAGTLEFV